MTDDGNSVAPEQSTVSTELATLRQENALLRRRAARLERELSSAVPLIAQARRLGVWDFTSYEVTPDESWVAIDRDKAMALMEALAHVDHWNPWSTTIEPRPQP